MLSEDKFFQTEDRNKIWQRYCGFLDLSIKEFMEIQQHLLLEQIDLVADSPLGRKIMNDQKPKTVEKFRQVVPLTSYDDYTPYLADKDEDALAIKPYCWIHTSGRGGNPKWVPMSERAAAVGWRRNSIAFMILCAASNRGEVRLQPGARMVVHAPPRPYGSAEGIYDLSDYFTLRTMPPVSEADSMTFPEKIEKSFKMAMRDGIDFVCSTSAVLVRMGEGFSQRSGRTKFSLSMLHPAVLFRFARARLYSKIQKRPMLPKDLWPAKGILCWGTDTSIYKDKIIYYWGQIPYEFYVFSEGGIVAIQSWNKKGMTFCPDLVFLEFIPEEEWLKSRENKEYQPATVLFDEVEEGKLYELVITSLHGMPFLRYRIEDLVRFDSIGDEETGITLPQMTFAGRSNDIIDVHGIARLDEKTVWQAIVNTGIDFEDWAMRKEIDKGEPVIRLYIEPKQEVKPEQLRHRLHEELKTIEQYYHEMATDLKVNPLRVKVLPRGTFQRYLATKAQEKAMLAQLKPSHMNASDEVINMLLKLSKEV